MEIMRLNLPKKVIVFQLAQVHAIKFLIRQPTRRISRGSSFFIFYNCI
jgi:hypothetical protein